VARKILLVANTGWYLFNFRLGLAEGLKRRGVEVVFVSPPDAFTGKFADAGVRWVELELDRGSLNPASGLQTIGRLIKIYHAERPNLVHHFTPKCVFFGTTAAKLAGVGGIVNSVTGLGHLAFDRRLVSRALFAAEKVLYRLALVHSRSRVIVQNNDDREMLTNLGLIPSERTTLIRGSGVDTRRYSPRPRQDAAAGAPIILYASRLLQPKGIYELVEAARSLKKRGVPARFLIAGEPDSGNPTSVPAATLEQWRAEGAIELLGHVNPIDEFLARASIVVLPSYREGMPKILLEASAMGKPVVTTDVPGCREAIIDRETGLLVPVADAKALERALETLLADAALRERMGTAGRRYVEREFSADRVIEETCRVYDDCLTDQVAT
jgi:glycosyltransferase involved in cell wall biosynthesis